MVIELNKIDYQFQFNIKEVIGMLLIEQVYGQGNIKCDYVKCPACKQGRLCDKPVGEKAMAIAVQGDSHLQRSYPEMSQMLPEVYYQLHKRITLMFRT